MSVLCPPEMLTLILRLKLFEGLVESELSELLSLAEMIECEKDDFIIREGEQGHHLFVLLAGSARITKRSMGIQKIIQTLAPGECFGEMSLIECRTRSASVRALSHCKLLRIDGENITQLPNISARIYRNIAILLSRRLRHANEVLTLG